MNFFFELLVLLFELILDIFISLKLLVDLLISELKLRNEFQDAHGRLLWRFWGSLNSQVHGLLVLGFVG